MIKSAELKQRCRDYLAERTSDYTFRCRRYDRVMDKMLYLRFKKHDSVMDVGAGSRDFLKRLHDFNYNPLPTQWEGKYTSVDGSYDGTDLNCWIPNKKSDFFVCIEVLEHLYDPLRLMKEMARCATKAVVVTTPNSEVVDTLGMDRTHVFPLYPHTFSLLGWSFETCSCFGKADDTILAWYKK